MIPDSFKSLPPFLIEDYEAIASDKIIPWDSFRSKTVFITGATGEIGREIVKTLLFVESKKKLGLRILCLARSREKAQKIFEGFLKDFAGVLTFVFGDVKTFDLTSPVDYVIHAASPTASAYFAEQPLETMDAIVEGSRHVIQVCQDKKATSMVFLSSMEVYGQINSTDVREEELGFLSLSSTRSSYPEAKRLAELYFFCANKALNLPVKTVRLTQTFGTHLSQKDNRVYAQFARSVRNGKEIVLRTEGKTSRDYLYTLDAVRAILSVLTLGEDGRSYNVSNPDSFLSIREMADLAASFSPKSRVLVHCDKTSAKLYPPTATIRLNNSRLNALNNFERKPIKLMFKHIICDIKTEDSD